MGIKSSEINREKLDWLLEKPIDTKLELLNQHLGICRLVVNSILDEEVHSYAGQRYNRDRPYGGNYQRWGYNPGSVKIGGQKLPVEVPRLYNKETGQFRPLEYYKRLQELPAQDRQFMESILHGISMRDYEGVVQQLYESFGMSAGSVSRNFKEESRKRLEEFEEKKLSDHTYVAVFVDGKQVAGEQMMIVLGVTEEGQKVPLGFLQTTTENHRSIKELFRDLKDRGLSYEGGLLFIIDGAKGLHKAIREVFGEEALIQRCQWHKRENIVSYLPEGQQSHYRKRLQSAYQQWDADQAREKLLEIKEELREINRQAARSLEEGLEETLTLQRLGLYEHFERSFTTTNCLESLNSHLDKYIGRVKRWQNSEQRYRWVVCALLKATQSMKRVANYKRLHLMQEKIKQQVQKRKSEKPRTSLQTGAKNRSVIFN